MIALDLLGAFAHHRGPGPGQVPELADRFGWHERTPDQPVRPELRQPRRIGHVRLTPRQVLDVPSVHEHHLERGVLKQVVERFPVVAGRLHHHQRDLLGDQVLPQRQHLIGDRPPRRHRRAGRRLSFP